MNYLAHLHLAGHGAAARIGNLSGDFVQGLDLCTLPAAIRAGVARHRAIDRFTDAHGVVRQSRARLAAPFRRLSGVLVDVFYDHFLARDWHRYDARPFDAFRRVVYAELTEHAALMPPRLAGAAPQMVAADWLGAYRTVAGIGSVLTRMARRLRRPQPLEAAVAELRSHYDALGADFAEFYPELQAFAAHAEASTASITR